MNQDFRPPIVHDLKTIPGPFDAVASGAKCYEIRKFDRDYQPRDLLLLREWLPGDDRYTGKTLWRRVTHITYPGAWGLPDGLCVMGIEPLDAGAYSLPTPEAR